MGREWVDRMVHTGNGFEIGFGIQSNTLYGPDTKVSSAKSIGETYTP